MLGLERGEVRLFPHENEWDKEAAETISKLRTVLGSAVNKIEHVGSTSVKTISAKPIIDIAIEADDFEKVIALSDEMRKNGFYLRKSRQENQLLFACGSFYDGSGKEQTHFIHVVKTDSREWNDYINFRNYLRKHPDAAEKYEALKKKLVLNSSSDNAREKYTEGKNSLISEFLKKANVVSFLGKTVDIVIDRPVGYVRETREFKTVYPLNYGYIPKTESGDGEEIDVYLLGVSKPVLNFRGKIIAVVHRRNDVEDKLVAAPEDMNFSKAQIERAVDFQERFFDSEIEM